MGDNTNVFDLLEFLYISLTFNIAYLYKYFPMGDGMVLFEEVDVLTTETNIVSRWTSIRKKG